MVHDNNNFAQMCTFFDEKCAHLGNVHISQNRVSSDPNSKQVMQLEGEVNSAFTNLDAEQKN